MSTVEFHRQYIECWLESFVIFQRNRISIAKKPYNFVIFQVGGGGGGGGGGSGPPVPPLDLQMSRIVCAFVVHMQQSLVFSKQGPSVNERGPYPSC